MFIKFEENDIIYIYCSIHLKTYEKVCEMSCAENARHKTTPL